MEHLLIRNVNEQLDRLVKQLADLEEFRNEMENDEYLQLKKDTMEQLQEFNATLSKLSNGNIRLLDEFSVMRMAIQAAISEAFKTPEIIALFAKKQPDALRQKLAELERDYKMKKITNSQQFIERKVEILTALNKLNSPLSSDETEFMKNHSSHQIVHFQLASSQLSDNVLNLAGAKPSTSS